MYVIKYTSKYKKDYKRIKSDNTLKKKINEVVRLLSENDIPLPEKYNDHQLKGAFANFRECHIQPDWLLVYKKTQKDLILMLVRTGTHSDLF
jgi:mRNA interferase YafQ